MEKKEPGNYSLKASPTQEVMYSDMSIRHSF